MDNELNNIREVTISVTSLSQLAAVYAVLAGNAVVPVRDVLSGNAKPVIPAVSAISETSAQGNPASDGPGPNATTDASPSDAVAGQVDAHGWPWSPELHASTQTQTKEGLWRMKVGVNRPDPKPGFPIEATGTSASGAASAPSPSATSTASTVSDDEDEFAAFRAAAENSEAKDKAAAASVPARKWTDADLSALCNQAALKLGDPAPIKAIVGEYVPEGEVPHSRNIPEEDRERFAQAIETKAGITFAG